MKNLTYRHLTIAITLVVVFVLAGIVIWKYRLSSLRNKQQKEISEIIHSVVQEQADKNLLLPQIVFIGVDSTGKEGLNKAMVDNISDLLVKKYTSDDTAKFNDIELKPFFVFPNKPNKQGNYTLTEVQLNELKGHLEFLTKQVDIEVDKAKEEVGRDIDRLNMWVTIWIGVIGFLGIFIPIIINIDIAKSTEKAAEKSDTASLKAEEAIKKIDGAKEKIDKIEGIETRVNGAETKLGEIERKTGEAETKSNSAESKADEAFQKAENALTKTKETEHVLAAMSAIGRLKDIDINTLPHIDKPVSVLIGTLHAIHVGLVNCNSQADNHIVKDCVRQLGVRVQLLTFFKFMKHENTEMANVFSGIVSDKLNNGYCKEHFEAILAELKKLADNLKTD